LLTLTKTEGQMWLALFNFICNAEIQKRYHFNSFRKGQLMRVRKYINEVLLDQLPVLADVQRFMDELALMEAPRPTDESGALMMEQVATTTEKLSKQRDWDALAKEQLEKIFSAQSDATDSDLRRLVDNVYTMDGIEDVMGEAPPSDLYAQELTSLSVVLLAATNEDASDAVQEPVDGAFDASAEPETKSASADITEIARFEYTFSGKPKSITTTAGPFLRRKFVAPAAAKSTALVENVLIKAELGFTGPLAFNTALCSEPMSFADKGDKPNKHWCQLGALKDKLAVQVQLVQPTAGAGFFVADAYSSTPAPFAG